MARCFATLSVSGTTIGCELDAPHDGWAHQNKLLDAVWCSDAEARLAAEKIGT